MDLSAEQLADLMNRTAVPQSDTMNEKRRAQRLERRGQLTVVPYTNGQVKPPIIVTVKDISPRGLGMMHTRAVPPGQQFVTRIPRSRGAPVNLLCTVVYCREMRDGQFSVGAEMTCVIGPNGEVREPLSDEEIERIRRSVLGEEQAQAAM